MASVKSKLESWTSVRSSFLYLMTLLHDANTFLLNGAFLLLTCSTMWECASRPCYCQDLILILNADIDSVSSVLLILMGVEVMFMMIPKQSLLGEIL